MKPSDDADVAQLMEEAADILDRDGWCQGAIMSNGKVCLIGALITAAIERGYVGPYSLGVSGEGMDIVGAARAVLSIRLNMIVSLWNDSPGRCKSEVVDLLVDTAKELRNG